MKEREPESSAEAIGDQPTALSSRPAAPTQGGGLAPGMMVSEYRVERELGRGGMGVVYAGTQPVIGKHVAIKVLSAEASRDAALGRRFVEEARAVNRIGHPSIIDIFSFGQLEDGRLYFVMEYLDGETLAALLERGGASERELCALIAQAADAIDAAHAKGIVHRDLKPENLWVARSEHGSPQLKVLDFGIAKLADPAASGITATGAVLGTPYYMAPEQCMGENVDTRADIYALGVILYRALTGRVPFTGSSLAEIVSQHVVKAPERPSALGAPLSPQLEALIMACLEKDPAKRPQRAAEVARALRSMTGEAGPIARATAPRKRAPVALIALAVVLAIAFAGLFVHFQTEAPPSSIQPGDAEPAAAATMDNKAPAEPAPKVEPEPKPEPAPMTPEPAVPSDRPRPKPSRAKADGLIEENPF